MNEFPMTNICGYILAGGKSSRMGSDKFLLRLENKTFVERAASALSAVTFDDIGIVGGMVDPYPAGSDTSRSGRPLRYIPDIPIEREFGDGRASGGALIGLYTALFDSKAPWVAVLACDLPFVTGDLITRLASYCSTGFDAIVPLQPDTRPQPLCAIYARKKCLSVVDAMIKNGDLKMQRLLSRINTRFAAFAEVSDLDSSSDFFLNVNTPEDYETALRIAAG